VSDCKAASGGKVPVSSVAGSGVAGSGVAGRAWLTAIGFKGLRTRSQENLNFTDNLEIM